MKQIYGIAFFLLPFLAFSQLYIKPYQGRDSYVYVQGNLLYVEKHIDLKSNPSQNTAASIYLRDEAQLLQGDNKSNNTGNGLLSIYQEGDATAYTYNYWSLPVQITDGPLLASSVIYDPLDKIYSRKALLTQELNGSTNPLKISSRWLYKLSGSGYSDWMYLGNSFNLSPGEGFTMKGVEGVNLNSSIYGILNNMGNRQRYDFRGRPNNGEITLPVEKNQILLVGNPYPSALDLKAFLEQNLSTSGIAYFWDSKPINSHYLTEYEGGYGAYSPAGGNNGYVPAAFSRYDREGNILEDVNSRGGNYARHYSPIAQGFIVEGVDNGTVVFKNEYRSFVKENPASSEFKAANRISPGKEKGATRIRLNIEFNDLFVRPLLILHHPGSTNGVDHAMDAKNLSLLSSDAGWAIDKKEYLIDVRPLDLQDQIPLLIFSSEEQKVNFSLEEVSNIESNIYLYDSETAAYHNLTESDFVVRLPEGNFQERFFLTFLAEEAEVDLLPLPAAINEYIVFQNNLFNRLEVTAPLKITPEKIELFDITGRKLREQKGKKEQGYYEFQTRNLSNGIYIVKITNPEGALFSKKVIISN